MFKAVLLIRIMEFFNNCITENCHEVKKLYYHIVWN